VRPFEYIDLSCLDSWFEVTKNKSIPLIDMWGHNDSSVELIDIYLACEG
jgi:hypothetical protein